MQIYSALAPSPVPEHGFFTFPYHAAGVPSKHKRLPSQGFPFQDGCRLRSQGFQDSSRIIFYQHELKSRRCRSSSGTAEKSPSDEPEPTKKIVNWKELARTATSLYPVYMVIGGIIAILKPSVYSWFVKRGPDSYSFSLALLTLCAGFTIRLEELIDVFLKRPFAVIFGCATKYLVLPSCSAIICRVMGLPYDLSVGLILLGCCPGGAAANVVTLIAQGDVALSVIMTTCSTLSAVVVTPLLTKFWAGALVPVDAAKLSISTLKIVVAPVLLGSLLQKGFPTAVNAVKHFSPLFAAITSTLLSCSVFSANIHLVNSSMTQLPENFSKMHIVNKQLAIIILSVILLHASGHMFGYMIAAVAGFRERQRRTISIEVGMQNSSLGVVLASTHFSSPFIAVPAALSAVIMNIMGSSLGAAWKNSPITSDAAKE